MATRCENCNGDVRRRCCKIPKLYFVSEDGIKFDLYVDGEKVNGIRQLRIDAAHDDFVTHEVEYLTAASGRATQ